MKQILEWQKKLDQVIMDGVDITDEQRLGNCITAMMVECSELANDVRYFKHWSNKGPDLEHAKEELIDVLHFWASIANQLGMSAEDVYKEYEKKRAVNFERQKNGY